MNIFKKTEQDQLAFNKFLSDMDTAIDRISPYSDCTDLGEFKKIRDSFINKTDDFFREDRKLNIGVIGQVKAGKSTFLNTLLFDGKNVLPSAATPKTATLTKIKYSETDSIQIEYYTSDEWRVLEEKAACDSEENEFVVAREIMKMVSENEINPYDFTAKGEETIAFSSPDELMLKLNSYVGENGKYTPMVKNVTIKLNRDELKDISVIDTPGLNDAIASRTDKTRQFIENCDVVFFLTRASQFMDNNDTRLLRTQLPQKGVKKMIAVASRFDNALNDVINDCDSIAQTISCTKSKLGSRALEIFSKQKESFPAEVYKACTEPIFVSSMFENISHKNDNDLNEAERFYFNTLNEFNDLTPAVVKEIGNFEPIREKFGNVVETKDETLSAKAKNFVPTSKAEAKNVLKALSQIAEKNLNILKTQDVEQIQNQKKAIANQINSTKGSIEEIFGNMDALLERAKMETLKELRDASRECAKLSERTGTETHIDSYTVSDTRLLHPFTWGKKHTVYTNYTTSYSYVDASDALENIRAFSSEACSDIEETFYKTVDIAATKRKLLNVIVENFDASDELYDPAFFRLVTEQTLNGIEFPVVKIDTSEKTKSVSSRFSGEIKGGDIYALRALMGTTIEEMLDEITDQFAKEVSGFKGKISELKTTFSDKLLETITGNLDNIIEQFNNKEREIHNYTDLLEILKKQPQLFA